MQHFDPNKVEYVFKDAAELDDPVAKAVNELTQELANFKAKNDGRLDEIEKKTIADLNRRLDEEIAKLQRPGAVAETKDVEREAETKALNKFIMGGVQALDAAELKTLNWGTPAAGGYVTAPQYSTSIIENITEFSPIRQLASVMSTTSQKVFFPVVTTKLAGGWVTETGSRPESQPVFDQLPIENFEHAVTVPISRQLLEDNFVDLAGYLASQIGTAFGKAESSAFVTGNGDGKPTGFMDDPDIYRFVEANMNGSDIVGKCIALHYHLEGAYAGRGSWLMNRRTQGLLRAAADNATKGLLWSDGLANGTPANFMGRPVYDVPDMENLYGEGSPPAIETFPIAFGDVASCYQILDRTAITLQRDDYTGADNGIVKFRAHRRVGGKVKQKEAMVVLKAVAQ